MKIANKTLFILLLLLFISNISSGAANCQQFKNDFERLYVALQQSLNYEHGDASFTPGKGLKINKNHQGDYQGKQFERMLFDQYQNSLRKVAALLVKEGNHQNSTEVYNENDIIGFFKAIDTTFDPKTNPDINSLIQKLKAKSEATFKESSDTNKIINENDAYLLSKLLVHAKDKICSVAKNAKKNKKDSKLVELSKYPLNRLIIALKSANINGNETIASIKSNSELMGDKTKTSAITVNDKGDIENIKVDEEKTIRSAVLDNLHAFDKWMQAHNSCRDYFMKSRGQFIQSGIQGCNFQKFVDSLGVDRQGISDFEKILHFINANQKKKLKAETNLDPLMLESYIDSAIKTSLMPSCEKIEDATFVRNLKYNGKTFDPTKNNFNCTNNGKSIDCNKAISLVSDDFGRGIKVVPKIKNIKFTIPESNCNSEMTLPDPNDSNSDNMILDSQIENNKDKSNQKSNNINSDKLNQSLIDSSTNKLNEITSNDSKENKDSIQTPPLTSDQDQTLNNDQSTDKLKNKTQKQLAILLKEEEKLCLAKGSKFDKSKPTKEERCFKSDLPLSSEKQKAEEKTCADKGFSYDPSKNTFDERCTDPKLNLNSEKMKAEELECTNKGKVFDGSKATPEERCTEKPAEIKTSDSNKSEDEIKTACEAAGKVYDPNGEDLHEKCKNKEKVSKGSRGGSSENETSDPFKDFLNSMGSQRTSTPQRFVPTQIPTRQMYILPGMP